MKYEYGLWTFNRTKGGPKDFCSYLKGFVWSFLHEGGHWTEPKAAKFFESRDGSGWLLSFALIWLGFVWSFLWGWTLDDFRELVGPDAGSSLSPATGHYFQGGPKAASHFQVQRSLLGEWSTSYMKLILNNDTRRHGYWALGALW